MLRSSRRRRVRPAQTKTASSGGGTLAFNLGDRAVVAPGPDPRAASPPSKRQSSASSVTPTSAARKVQPAPRRASAQAIKRYLVNLGVPESKLSVISYGEERPIAEGSNESSWQKNRRAEFSDHDQGDPDPALTSARRLLRTAEPRSGDGE